MGILNRRNAVTGWAVWKVVQRLVRRKLERFRPAPPPPKKRPIKSAVAVGGAAAVGAATLIRRRKRNQD